MADPTQEKQRSGLLSANATHGRGSLSDGYLVYPIVDGDLIGQGHGHPQRNQDQEYRKQVRPTPLAFLEHRRTDERLNFYSPWIIKVYNTYKTNKAHTENQKTKRSGSGAFSSAGTLVSNSD